MCNDFQGFSKPLFNYQLVNVQKHLRFVLVNNSAVPQNLTKNFYKIIKTFTVSHSNKVDYTFPLIRLLLAGKKIIF